MRALTTGRPEKQVERIGKQKQTKANASANRTHFVVNVFRNGVPAFIGINVAGVGVVGAVTNSPAVIGHQNGRVSQMANQVVEPFVLGERTVAAVVTDDEQRPKHCALSEPKNRKEQPGIETVSDRIKASNNADI